MGVRFERFSAKLLGQSESRYGNQQLGLPSNTHTVRVAVARQLVREQFDGAAFQQGSTARIVTTSEQLADRSVKNIDHDN